MNKRIISIVLCVALMMSFFMPAVSAAEDDSIFIDNTVISDSDAVENSPESALVTTEAEDVTVSVPAETESVTDSPEAEVIEEPEAMVPACDCGRSTSVVALHADNCAMKQFCKDLCAGTGSDIFAVWNDLPKNSQAYVMTCLGIESPVTLKELVFLLASNWESESGLSGVASAIKDNTLFGAFGIPEDAVLQIKEAAAEAKAAIEAFVAKQGDDVKELFTWDISVLDGEGINWQPDGSVRVELELPGEKLHKHSKVYVVHVDDEGNAEKIEAEVIDGNKIAFNTNGFSTFAAFTVDFEYNGEPFSIPGMSSILLSELMDKLKMPFDVEEVADVEFTNYDLVSVEKQGSDWKLTSLQAFTSNEILTLTMNDGKVYEIKVTDATNVSIYYNNSGNQDGGTLGVVEWYLHDSRYGGQAYSGANSNNAAPGWTEDYDIYIDGTGATDKNFEIVLQRHNYATGRTLYVDLHTVWIKGGANLTFRLGASITKDNTDQIIVRQVRGYHDDSYGDEWWFGEMFWVENGSLNLQVPYAQAGGVHEGVKMVFDWDSGNNNNPSGNGPKALVSLRYHATSFKANQCVFQNTQEAAIVCRANDMKEFIMTNCEFTNTSKPGGNGAGIYMMSNTADSAGDYVDIHRFELNNCTFTNSVGAGYGGAVALFGYVHSGLVSGCTFTNCKSTGQGGGALELAGNMGAFTIQNSTFSGCTSKYRGGAIEIRSTNIKNSSDQERWTRSNSITISGCTFTDCSSSDSHGGAVAVKAQLHTFSVSGSSFTNCVAGINGGAISIDGQDLPDTFADSGSANPNWTAALSCSDCVTKYGTIGTTMSGSYNWLNNEDSSKTIDKKSIVGTVNITDNCKFLNCSCASNGGTIEFASGMYITKSATISDTIIDGGKAVNGGSAIFTSTCIIKLLNLHDDVFQNCDFNPGGNDVGGTVRTTGPTTIVLDVQRCQFLNNKSYGNAGGLYWNAARSLDGITCEATINDCLFDGNEAGIYGGGIYVESKMTITKCHIKNNTAGIMGGGIAQQVYNNPGVRMLENGDVTELKLDPTTWIHHNTAPVGGGISIRANETGSIVDGQPIDMTVRFELNGAAVYENTAIKNADGTGGHGGGIYFIAETCSDPLKQAEVDKYSKVILINQGTGTAAAVYNNTAEGNGGGIYMESSENTELRVQGGHISTNSAVNGGGIYMTGKNATCYVQGGTIGGEGNDSQGKPLANTANKAADGNGGNGGGIAISGGAKIEMSVPAGQTSGGVISYNTAEGNGGGIWLDGAQTREEGNTIEISEGQVIHNEANGDGGGIATNVFATVNMTGGTIANNTAASSGGGIFAYYYTNFTMSGGTIEDNTATNGSGGGIDAYFYSNVTLEEGCTIQNNKAEKGNGGGIYCYNSTIDVQGGEVTNNTAISGGGLASHGSSSITIKGGSIHKNTAAAGGGLYVVGNFNFDSETKEPVYDAVVTIEGGEIKENTATGNGLYNGQGGGIYADRFVNVIVKQSEDGMTVGKITENKASKGGGVYVACGAKLEVINGFIIKNKALVPENKTNTYTTTYQENHGLYGVGGGIYVADGYNVTDKTTGETAIVPASFKLSGDNIAIYGNLADFAADDVFSNAKDTKLDVPQVQNMNLAGYSFKPDGWVEDYCYADTQYEIGTESVLKTGKFVNGNEAEKDSQKNVRYREADRFDRIVIPDEKVAAAINPYNAFICMTLGIPADLNEKVGYSFYLVDEEGNFLNEKGEIVDDISEAYKVIVPQYETVMEDTFEVVGKDVFTESGLDNQYIMYDPNATFDATYKEEKDGNTYNYWETNDDKDTTYVTTDGGLTYSNEETSYDPTKPDANMQETIVYFPVIAPKLGYSFYLVDENGNPINAEGEVVQNFADSEKIMDPVYQIVIGDGKTMEAEDVYNEAGLSNYFELYSPEASYDLIFNEEKNGKTYNYWETNDEKDSTYVTTDEGKTYSNADTNFDANKPDAELYNSLVYYAVRLKEIAVEDKIVIDFGIPVKINVLSNDGLATGSKVLGIKKTGTTLVAGTKPNSTYISAFDGTYGSVVLGADSVITYSLTDMNMSDVDVFSYVAQDATYGYHYYAKVTVIPATIIYFEDNFKNDDGKDFITYKTYTYTVGTGTPTKNVEVENIWTSHSYSTPKDVYQAEDRPGQMTTGDANNIYGFDGSYNTSSIYSMHTAMKFTASISGNVKTLGTAEFNFTGTGFDVISFTSDSTGLIMVEVLKDGKSVKRAIVDTYYGYSYDEENKKWEVNTNSKGGVYQVPVLKVEGLEYGTYTAIITASYDELFDHRPEQKDRSYEFYLDAIRIYDPADNGSKNKVIEDAYVADNEGWPEYHELRNMILDPDGNGSLDSDTTLNDNIIFIDGLKTDDISKYMNYGPNNEVYLAKDQSVAFKFTPDASMAAVHIALRSSQNYAYFNIANADGKKLSSSEKFVGSSDVYFDITPLLKDSNGNLTEQTIIITCTNHVYPNTGVLAISTVKVTHKAKPAEGKNVSPFSVSRETINEALAYLAGLESEQDPAVTEGKIGVIGATLSFESVINANLYYSTDLDVDVADMGLLTWDTMPAVAAHENAQNVISGAQYDAENDRYMVSTNGIAAKNLGDDIYMCVYAKLADGSYVYSDVITYSPKTYAMNRLEKSEDENLKALCVAMLNYGAAAQNYFGYKTENLMNAELTADQQALVAAYSADLFSGAIAADPAKAGEFAKTQNGFNGISASVSFEGAFAINYYFSAAEAVDGEMMFYVWNSADYANAEVLSAENATAASAMVVNGNGAYWAQISDIAANEVDDTYYVAAVYSANGETYCSGVIAYSLSTYCVKNAANGSAMESLAQSTAMYGYHADVYFNKEG